MKQAYAPPLATSARPPPTAGRPALRLRARSSPSPPRSIIWVSALTCRLRGRQVADQAHELAALCPASTVGEWSAARPPDVAELGVSGSPTRREFFELQLRLWSACTTHGSFFWCWSDNSGPDWCLRALVPGRREALTAAAESVAPIWTTSYTRPPEEGEEGEEGYDLDSASPETALEAVWIASASPAPSSASLRDCSSPDTSRRRLEPVTPMSISARYDY